MKFIIRALKVARMALTILAVAGIFATLYVTSIEFEDRSYNDEIQEGLVYDREKEENDVWVYAILMFAFSTAIPAAFALGTHGLVVLLSGYNRRNEIKHQLLDSAKVVAEAQQQDGGPSKETTIRQRMVDQHLFEINSRVR